MSFWEEIDVFQHLNRKKRRKFSFQKLKFIKPFPLMKGIANAVFSEHLKYIFEEKLLFVLFVYLITDL